MGGATVVVVVMVVVGFLWHFGLRFDEIQQIIHDDVPYVFISGGVGDTGYRNRWAGIDPGPWSFYWNVHQWYDTTLAP